MPRSPCGSPLNPRRASGPRPLARVELPPDTVGLARALLGKLIVRQLDGAVAVARIVETEAYVVGDAASHAFRGRTRRNASMFLGRGFAYVYFIYGTAYCLNVTSEEEGIGAAVLVRAAEPLAGLEAMRMLRPCAADRDLLRGPGRLAAALAIDTQLDGSDLCAPGPLYLAGDGDLPPRIGTSARIGLTREVERPLRFYRAGSPYVSGPRKLSP